MDASQNGAGADRLRKINPFDGPVIVIEDSQDDAFLLTRLLRRAGIANEVLCCSGRREFSELISKRATQLPLIILSLSLKLEPGLQLLRELKADANYSRTLVITIGNSARPEDIQEALDLGANGYYAKGIDFGELAATIQNLEILNKGENEQT